jgi:hypothetical protein
MRSNFRKLESVLYAMHNVGQATVLVLQLNWLLFLALCVYQLSEQVQKEGRVRQQMFLLYTGTNEASQYKEDLWISAEGTLLALEYLSALANDKRVFGGDLFMLETCVRAAAVLDGMNAQEPLDDYQELLDLYFPSTMVLSAVDAERLSQRNGQGTDLEMRRNHLYYLRRQLEAYAAAKKFKGGPVAMQNAKATMEKLEQQYSRSVLASKARNYLMWLMGRLNMHASVWLEDVSTDLLATGEYKMPELDEMDVADEESEPPSPKPAPVPARRKPGRPPAAKQVEVEEVAEEEEEVSVPKRKGGRPPKAAAVDTTVVPEAARQLQTRSEKLKSVANAFAEDDASGSACMITLSCAGCSLQGPWL